MFVLLVSRNLAPSQSTVRVRECKANGLAYSRCPANTNDLATPLGLATFTGDLWLLALSNDFVSCTYILILLALLWLAIYPGCLYNSTSVGQTQFISLLDTYTCWVSTHILLILES